MTGRRSFSSEHLVDQLLDLRLFERSQPLDTQRAETKQGLLCAAQSLIRVALGIVVGTDQDNLLVADLARDEMQQLQRGNVGPLQILQNDEQRLLGREPGQELAEIPEEPRLDLRGIGPRRRAIACTGSGEMGKDVAEFRCAAAREQGERRRLELTDQGQQCVGEKRIRHPCLDGVCPANRDAPAALYSTVGCCRGEPGFANATFADDENRATSALGRLIHRLREERKLVATPDQRRRGSSTSEHGANVRTSVYGSQTGAHHPTGPRRGRTSY